jgi:LacI family transcriptional regulator
LATIYDIAREANVGIGTVSRVLNNHPSVAVKTRERVLSVVGRFDYQPHVYAQGLARKRTRTISAIIPFFTNYFFVEVLQGVQDKITELGYDLILYGISEPAHVDTYLRRASQKGRIDGGLFFSMRLPDVYAERFVNLNIPMVLVDTFNENFDSIVVENFEGARIATSHLIRLGHRRIGMIDGSPESTPGRERLEGFKSALKDYGVPFEEKFFKVSPLSKQDGFNREAGYVAMKEIVQSGHELPTAVFISSDIQAIGAISALRDQRMTVPDDVAIVGFDDIELSRYFGLTTMHQPMYRMGVLAVEKLMERIENPDSPCAHLKFLPELIVRESCGARFLKKPMASTSVSRH